MTTADCAGRSIVGRRTHINRMVVLGLTPLRCDVRGGKLLLLPTSVCVCVRVMRGPVGAGEPADGCSAFDVDSNPQRAHNYH